MRSNRVTLMVMILTVTTKVLCTQETWVAQERTQKNAPGYARPFCPKVWFADALRTVLTRVFTATEATLMQGIAYVFLRYISVVSMMFMQFYH